MTPRTTLLLCLFALPAAALLLFGPRQTTDTPTDRTVVRYWEKWSGVEAIAMQRLVDRFNETTGREKGIWVEYHTVSNVDQRTLVATAGGDPPDLAGLFDYVVAQFADQGALTDLAPLVREYEIDTDAFQPIWLDICTYEGRLVALPSTPFTVALYYNRRLFREAGLDPDRPPQTTAELDECVRRLTRYDDDGRITQLGFTVSPAMLGWWHWVWPCFFDLRPWDGQRFHLDTPEGLAAYEWIARQRAMIGNQKALDFEAGAGSIESMQNPFLSERLAIVFQGPWVSNWARTYTPDLDYAVAPFPSESRERRNVFASCDVLVIPNGAPHAREAMEFLRFLMKQENLEELNRTQCKLSPFRQPRPEFFDGHPNPYIHVFDEMAASPDAFGYPKMPMWAEVWTETLYMLENVIRAQATPRDAVAGAQKKVDSIVQKYQAMSAERRALAAAGD